MSDDDKRLLAAKALLARRGFVHPRLNEVTTEIRSDGIIKFEDPAPGPLPAFAPQGIMSTVWEYTLPWGTANELRSWLGQAVMNGAGAQVSPTVEDWFHAQRGAIGVGYGGTFVSVGTPKAEIRTYWWFQTAAAIATLSTQLKNAVPAAAPPALGPGLPVPQDNIFEMMRQFRYWAEQDPDHRYRNIQLLSTFNDFGQLWDAAPLVALGLRI